MANYISMDDLRFVLHEVLKVEELCQLERFQDYDKESFDILLDSIKDFSDKELFPVFAEIDADPARYEDGKIYVHPVVGTVMKFGGENGLIGATFSNENGGLQLPHVVHSAVMMIATAANNHLPGYLGLTGGAAGLLGAYASQELKDRYMPNMMAGKWGGTMCLTEPQAGSSLSDITTVAISQEDGSYQIKGQKIFISGGDHEYAENFVHLVLARIEGAPAGSKGISLFVVPKKRITEDGGLEGNDVITAGDFQKMGQKGYCTTHLVFGENNNCQGWLVGKENRGLLNMFQMMNGARIEVGLTGVAIASAAYHASLQYAKERPQGRRIKANGVKDKNEVQTTIINHPDVRRMLLLQRAVVEGSTALIMEASMYHDLSMAGAEEDREKYHDLLELLTPIVKTYPSEMGRTSINNGLQIFGGYGFCAEFPLQQHLRDSRILSLYEGTTGIQSMDLLGRKVIMKNGETMRLLTKEFIAAAKAASNYDELKPYAAEFTQASKDLGEVITHLVGFAMKGEHELFIADANIFMEQMSNVVLAWQWLKLATVAKTALVTGNGNYTNEFYEGKIHTMKYFFKYELPKNLASKVTLMRPESLTIIEENKTIFA